MPGVASKLPTFHNSSGEMSIEAPEVVAQRGQALTRELLKRKIAHSFMASGKS
jgi:hypothetical protein